MEGIQDFLFSFFVCLFCGLVGGFGGFYFDLSNFLFYRVFKFPCRVIRILGIMLFNFICSRDMREGDGADRVGYLYLSKIKITLYPFWQLIGKYCCNPQLL